MSRRTRLAAERACARSCQVHARHYSELCSLSQALRFRLREIEFDNCRISRHVRSNVRRFVQDVDVALEDVECFAESLAAQRRVDQETAITRIDLLRS